MACSVSCAQSQFGLAMSSLVPSQVAAVCVVFDATLELAKEHYPIVGAAFLKTLNVGLGSTYTPEVKDAYTAMWGVVSSAMQEGSKDLVKGTPPSSSKSKASASKLSQKQVKLIKKTWAKVEAIGAEKAGVLLFQHIFEAAPEAASLFPFGREAGFDPKGDLSKNTALVAHASGV
eukprot:5916280-Amphidinium_carterae.1